ncbi:MAG: hypothetical protein IPL39_25160 [Opitutaceae bacterium]|nr:hypothetical protein [Opitutaceae bacterium]
MADLRWRTGPDAWKAAHLALFSVLSALVAFGCTQALVGFALRRGTRRPLRIDPRKPTRRCRPAPPPSMPVYNGEAGRVFSSACAPSTDRCATPDQLGAFHFYV